MKINFRQGIISAQTNNNFIELVNGSVNINVDIDTINLAFAYSYHDYLFTEDANIAAAWSSFPSNKTVYLYWDINIVTGLRTFGFTSVQPQFGSQLPINPLLDQHYFDLNDKKMKVWNGINWEEKIRVFAGYVSNNAILTAYTIGSQVNLNANIDIGYILFDKDNLPVRYKDKNSNYYFLTTTDDIHTQNDPFNSYRIDGSIIDAQAVESIPAYHCVTWKKPRQIGLASYVDYQYPCIGFSVEPFGKGEVKKFVTKGFVTNYNNWNWVDPPNTALFVGANGEPTTSVPQKWSLQKIGHIVSPDTIFLNIQEQILLEIIEHTPSPTPTITLTPSPTPTITLTPSPTITPTITPSATVTPTLTPSATAPTVT